MTGAIFARGSCRTFRTLMWAAIVGVILALGAGQASAQTITLTVAEEVSEGSAVDVTITARGSFAVGVPAAAETLVVSFSATAVSTGMKDAEVEDYILPADVTLTFPAKIATAPADFLVAIGDAAASDP